MEIIQWIGYLIIFGKQPWGGGLYLSLLNKPGVYIMQKYVGDEGEKEDQLRLEGKI